MSEKPNIFDLPIGRVPTVTLAGAADLLAAVFPGEEKAKLSEAFRSLAKAKLIPRRYDENGVYSYGPVGLGTAALLIAAHDHFGVRSGAITRAIVTACNVWSDADPRPPHIPPGVRPIVAASVMVTRGEPWAFKLTDFYDRRTHRRAMLAAIYPVDGPEPNGGFLPPDYWPCGTLTIPLWEFLEPLDAIYNGLRAVMAGFDA